MIYPPGYPTLLAVLGFFGGLTHGIGRMVSLAGTIAAAAAILYGTWRQGRSAPVGWLAAIAFLGLYPASGAFYDLVRPDALSLGLLAWAIVLGMERSRQALYASGLLLCAAFLCKHNAAAYGPAIAIAILARSGWRDALRFGLAALVPALTFTALIALVSEGRFLDYLLAVPGSHPMVQDRVIPGTPQELGHALPVGMALIATWLVVRGEDWAERIPVPVMAGFPVVLAVLAGWLMAYLPAVRGITPAAPIEKTIGFAFLGAVVGHGILVLIGTMLTRRVSWRWVYGALVGTTAVVTVGLMRGHHGGFVNVFMPAHFVLCLGMGVVVADMVGRVRRVPGALLVCVAFTAQLAVLHHRLDPDDLVPTQEDRAAGAEIIAALQEVDGPVLSPFAPWLPVQAGHDPAFHLIALWDVKHPRGPFRTDVNRISNAIRDHHWGAVLDASETFGYGVQKYYVEDQEFVFGSKALMPKTGWRRRPRSLMVPAAAR